MANVSVTYTFSNGTTADATQVNTNFNDIINGTSDGTKDFAISALTCSGAATFNGNLSIGNGSVDDLTITASLASNIAIKTTFTYGIGSSTVGLTGIYFGSSDSAARTVRIIGGVIGTSYTLTLPTGAGSANQSMVTSGSGTLLFENRMAPGDVYNLGLSLSAGVLSITDMGGTALSTTNKGKIIMQSTTAGQTVALDVTGTFSINDDSHASSDFTNFGGGLTEAVDWQDDRPIFVYAINRANSNFTGSDGDSVIALSLSPFHKTSPSAANSIGDTGAIPVTDAEGSVIIMADVTVANYTSLPMQLIGILRVRWLASTADYTFQALAQYDGLGPAQLFKGSSRTFTMAIGQNGAVTNTYMTLNGGTSPPAFSTNSYQYKIDIYNNLVHCFIFFNGDGGTDGVGAVTAYIVLPYTTTSLACTNGIVSINKSTGAEFGAFENEASSKTIKINGSDRAAMTLAEWGNGARTISGTYTYMPGI